MFTHSNKRSRLGPAVKIIMSGWSAAFRISVRYRFGSPLSSKAVGCGHCLLTLSLTINQTLKWLSSLPILIQGLFWWYSIMYSLPIFPTSWDLGPRQFLFGDNSALKRFNQPTSRHSDKSNKYFRLSLNILATTWFQSAFLPEKAFAM